MDPMINGMAFRVQTKINALPTEYRHTVQVSLESRACKGYFVVSAISAGASLSRFETHSAEACHRYLCGYLDAMRNLFPSGR